jgi:hypothetical protein
MVIIDGFTQDRASLKEVSLFTNLIFLLLLSIDFQFLCRENLQQ